MQINFNLFSDIKRVFICGVKLISEWIKTFIKRSFWIKHISPSSFLFRYENWSSFNVFSMFLCRILIFIVIYVLTCHAICQSELLKYEGSRNSTCFGRSEETLFYVLSKIHYMFLFEKKIRKSKEDRISLLSKRHRKGKE